MQSLPDIVYSVKCSADSQIFLWQKFCGLATQRDTQSSMLRWKSMRMYITKEKIAQVHKSNT